MRSPDQPVRIGMLGCGVVGSEVARLILADTVELSTRAGAKIELAKIAVREIKPRAGIPTELFTLDALSIVNDPTIDLIIEVMGGIDPARDLILTAIGNRKSIVTANKALLASHGAVSLAQPMLKAKIFTMRQPWLAQFQSFARCAIHLLVTTSFA